MHRSEAALRSAAGGRRTYAFLFLVRAKVIVLGARVAKPSGGHEKSQVPSALCSTAEEKRVKRWVDPIRIEHF
jgi:hypothetical protein